MRIQHPTAQNVRVTLLILLCVFSRAPRLLKVMGIAVPRPPHNGGAAAGGVIHPVLA